MKTKVNDFIFFAKKFMSIIKASSNILILPHINMDGDALGSSLALYEILTKMGKNSYIYTTDSIPKMFDFMPGIKFVKDKLPDYEFDCAIMSECPNYSRSPAGKDFKAKVIINIDHHPDNEMYGDINWVQPEVSSLGEIIYKTLDYLKLPLSYETVLNLYIAIYTDTGGFIFPSCTYETHSVISKMLKAYKLPTEYIYRRVYKEVNENVLRLMGKLTETMKVFKEGFAMAFLTKKLMDQYSVKDSDAQNISKDLNVMRGVHTFVLLREIEINIIKCSLRSYKYPIGKIAKFFGGGGHLRASGCTIEGSMKDASKKLEKEIKHMINSEDILPD